MSTIFKSLSVRKPGRNRFDLSHEKKLSLKMGDLIPILVQEVVPGDSFKVNTEMLLRLSPLLAPMMHRVNVSVQFFFVPNRLVWDNWQNFITGGVDGTTSPAFPRGIVIDANKQYYTAGTLPDYLGLPDLKQLDLSAGAQIKYNVLPVRAYNLIWNEYYRDQNLQTPIDYEKDQDGDFTVPVNLIEIKKRAWEKDYFTSALPWPQRGADVLLPNDIQYLNPAKVYDDWPNLTAPDGALQSGNTTGDLKLQGTGQDLTIENIESLGITVNDLRKSVRLQEWLEKNARAGARYIEQIFAHFGVRSSDARLQRPEYLGGVKQPVVVSEVLSTFDSAETPGAQMYGHGISAGRNYAFKRWFEEHGYIMGILSVMPKPAYQQGIPKMYDKASKFDFYFPEFANIGEQEIKKRELYVNNTDAYNEATFGYTPRYAEYKFGMNTVHGQFKSTLNYWHMGRIFETAPQLNEDFVKADPTDRVFAVTDPAEDKVFIQIWNDIKAVRPMPVFGTPTL